MRFLKFVFTFLLINISLGRVLSLENEFLEANRYYAEQKYSQAIEAYERILNAGFASANLYYNLGNCYFKKKELGKAIYYYEKAKRLMPLDKDLAANLKYVSSLVKGGYPSARGFKKFLDYLFGCFNLDVLTILVSFIFFLILGIIFVARFFVSFRRVSVFLGVFLGVFFVLSLFSLQERISLLNKEAIVGKEKINARFEPLSLSTTHFYLYEGQKIRILVQQGDWFKVKRWDNKIGWVEREALLIF